MKPRELEREVVKRGTALWGDSAGKERSILDTLLLGEALRGEQFHADLFRLVDVLPALARPSAITEHVRVYLARPRCKLPALLALATRAARTGCAAPIVAASIGPTGHQDRRRAHLWIDGCRDDHSVAADARTRDRVLR